MAEHTTITADVALSGLGYYRRLFADYASFSAALDGNPGIADGRYRIDHDEQMQADEGLTFTPPSERVVSGGAVTSSKNLSPMAPARVSGGSSMYVNDLVNLVEVDIREYGGVTISQNPTPPSLSVMEANSAALNAAIRDRIRDGGGDIVIPTGYMHVYGTHEISLSVATPIFGGYSYDAIRVGIRGKRRSAIIQNHPTDALFLFHQLGLGGPDFRGLTIAGRGSLTTGPLFSVYSSSQWSFKRMRIGWHGGHGMLFIENCERGLMQDVSFYQLRQAIRNSGLSAFNENLLQHCRFIGVGQAKDIAGNDAYTKSYSVNAASGGKTIKTSGEYYQEHNAAVELENVSTTEMSCCSFKVTDHLAGIRVNAVEHFAIRHAYFEGYGLGANPAIIAKGKAKAALLTAELSASETVAYGDDDLFWFPLRITDDRQLLRGTVPVGLNKFVLHQVGNPAVYEVVTVESVKGNSIKLSARGLDGTTARAWPAGTRIAQHLGAYNICIVQIDSCNLLSCQITPGTSTLVQSVANGYTAGEIIVGNVYDEFNTRDIVHPNGAAVIEITESRMGPHEATNSGKIQAWYGAKLIFGAMSILEGKRITDYVVGADADVNSPMFTVWDAKSQDEVFIARNSNNLPSGLRRQASVNLGGSGETNFLSGERGIALAKESAIGTFFASIEDKTEEAFKIWHTLSGALAYDIALRKQSIKVGGSAIYFGAGSPEGAKTAAVGSIYFRTDGGALTALYVKETGAGNTGWVAK